uniref:Uncharacterized protein n=1 Tax=Odontella aurita TaxID=265563 RepID=A0A6U6FVL5_9STRA
MADPSSLRAWGQAKIREEHLCSTQNKTCTVTFCCCFLLILAIQTHRGSNKGGIFATNPSLSTPLQSLHWKMTKEESDESSQKVHSILLHESSHKDSQYT